MQTVKAIFWYKIMNNKFFVLSSSEMQEIFRIVESDADKDSRERDSPPAAGHTNTIFLTAAAAIPAERLQ